VLWVLWRFLQRSDAPPRTNYVAVAIAASAILFGAGHLPVGSAMLGALTNDVVAYVILGNAAFGILAGNLFPD
jgi:membrane protease YdiL (CAAX protease family)